MKIGMTGLQSAGRTTVFNALTRGHAETGPVAGRDGNIGIARVPDERLGVVAGIFESRTSVQAEITYVDLPSSRSGEGDLFSGENATRLQQVDALLAVVRSFDDDSVPHLEGSVDWRRDLEKIMFDLNFADIDLIERRIERINDSIKGMRSSERVTALQMIETFRGIQQELENGVPVRAQDPAVTADPSIRDTFLLSALPFLAAINIDEDELSRSAEYESDLGDSDFRPAGRGHDHRRQARNGAWATGAGGRRGRHAGGVGRRRARAVPDGPPFLRRPWPHHFLHGHGKGGAGLGHC